MRGKETIQRHSERLVVYNNSKVALFWGKCFLCLCVGHSQRYCPLKYCGKCNTYGHSVVTCANPKNNTIRKHLNLTSGQKVHPSITSKNWRNGRGYKQQKYRSRQVHYQPQINKPVEESEPSENKVPDNKPSVPTPVAPTANNNATTVHTSSSDHDDRGKGALGQAKENGPSPDSTPKPTQNAQGDGT
jgi:hypothetical protein